MEKMDIDINVMGKKINQIPSSLRKQVNGDVKKPNLKTVMDITEYVDSINLQRTYRKNTNRIPLPAKVSIINPILFEKAINERGLTNSELYEHVKKQKGTISFSTLNKYIRNDLGPMGPSYPVSLLISKSIEKFPILTAKERAVKKSFNLVDDYFDEEGKPQLSKDAKWDFYTAQQEWLERDQKKLKKSSESACNPYQVVYSGPVNDKERLHYEKQKDKLCICQRR